MAKSKFNVVTHGMSGLIGDLLVFRQRANKTIVANRPKPTTKQVSAVQIAIRERFKRASRYAKIAMKDPVLKAAYQLMVKPGQTAHNVAFADFQKAPEFYEDINLAAYTGAVGEEITISVIDDFNVKLVHVEIRTPDGTLLEEGDAVQSDNELDWTFTTTVINSEVAGSRIIFTASDLPGNRTVLEKLLM